METSEPTLFVTNFPEHFDKCDLADLFNKYGEIIGVVLPNDKKYCMIKYNNFGSCNTAIYSLKGKPPHNLRIAMARSHKSGDANNSVDMSNKPRGNFRNNKKVMTLDTRLYFDLNNQKVEAYCDEIGEVYVPLSKVTNIKCGATINNSYVENETKRYRSSSSSRLSNSSFQEKGKYQQKRVSNSPEAMDDLMKNAPASVRRNVRNLSVTIDKSARVVREGPSINNDNYGWNNGHLSDTQEKLQHAQPPVRRSRESLPANFNKMPFKSSRESLPNNFSKPASNESEDWNHETPIETHEKPQHAKPDERAFRQSLPGNVNSNNNVFERRDSRQNVKPLERTISKESIASNTSKTSITMEKKFDPTNSNTSKSNIHIENKFVPTNSNINKASVNIEKKFDLSKPPYKYITLPSNVYTTVEVQSIVDENTAWVQNVNIIDFQTQLMEKIIKSFPTVGQVKPELGKMCLAKFEDLWFRAVVIQVSPTLRVKFLEYGNESDDPPGGLYDLVPELKMVPAQALCIKLMNGAPCKITHEQQHLTVKPVKVENNVVFVRVENGMYSEDEAEQKENSVSETRRPIEKSQVSVLKSAYEKISDALFREILVDSTGVVSLTNQLSKNKFVAFIVVCEFAAYIAELDGIQCDFDANFKPKVGDLAMIKDVNKWYRVLILEAAEHSYEVALFDFGTIQTAEQFGRVPQEILSIPQFSCICTLENEDTDSMQDLNVERQFTVIGTNGKNIRILLDNALEMTIEPWNPMNKEMRPKSEIAIKKQTIPEVKLNSGEAVRLECESNGCLYLRTKGTHETLKKVNDYMNKLKKVKPLLDIPVKGQFVAAEYDNNWYRAVVKTVENKIIDVFYIDYGNEEKKPLQLLGELPEEMYELSNTLFEIKLPNINKDFTKEEITYMGKISEQRVVLKAEVIDESKNIVELFLKSGEKLMNGLKKTEVKVAPSKDDSSDISLNDSRLSGKFDCSRVKVPGKADPLILDISVQKIPLGNHIIKCLWPVDITTGTFCFCLSDSDASGNYTDLINKMTEYCERFAPPDAYRPVTNEIVIAKLEGKWHRALCVEEKSEYFFSLFFIDCGCEKNVQSSNIRRAPVEFTTLEAIANFGVIQGIHEKSSNNLIKRLEELLTLDDTHAAKILAQSAEDQTYTVDLPKIKKILLQENLL